MVPVSTTRGRYAHNPLWRQTGKYRVVQATPEEVQAFKAKNRRNPDLRLLECDCGKRIWASGMGIGSHERACAIVYTGQQHYELADARRQGICSTIGQLEKLKVKHNTSDLGKLALIVKHERQVAEVARRAELERLDNEREAARAAEVKALNEARNARLAAVAVKDRDACRTFLERIRAETADLAILVERAPDTTDFANIAQSLSNAFGRLSGACERLEAAEAREQWGAVRA